MKLIKRMSVLVSAAAFLVALYPAQIVKAHVTVKPAEVMTSSYQTFTVSVPNEKIIPTVKVQLIVPEHINSVTVTNKPSWNIDIEKDGDKTRSITWSNSEIKDGFRDEFTFSAKTPDEAKDLEWKAYQTYSDGTVVAWDQPASESGQSHEESPNEGPFSVTKVSAEVEQAPELPKNESQTVLYFAIAGVFLGLMAIYISLRNNKD